MDYEDSNGNDSFDSDAVDEELERQLYGAIFFASSPPHLSEHDSKSSACTFEQSMPSPQLTVTPLPYDKENEHKKHKMHPKSQVSDVSASKSVGSASKSVGSALVSSFKDQSSSECDEGFEIMGAEVTETDDFSSTQYTTEESEWESISSANSRRPEISCNPARSSSDPVWDAQNLVLGVSHQASGIVCNADDSVIIARRLASSSSDPNLWRINNEDRCTKRSKSSRERYFNDSHNSICSNCKKRGHLAMDCSNSGPICILCGEEGHERDNCNRVYCYACFSPGHFKHSCTLLECLKRSICKRCGLQGHQAHLCTELWRQYRNTTEPGKPKPIPRKLENQPGGCCNCGNRGHTVDECRRKPFRSNFLGPPPRRRVLVYDQKDIYKRAKYKSLKTATSDAAPDKAVNTNRYKVKNKVKEKAKLSKRQKQLISKKASRVDLPRLELPDERTKQQKRMKKRVKGSPTPQTESDLTLLEQSVHEKLFKQIQDQQNAPAEMSEHLHAPTNTEEKPAPHPQNESTPMGSRRRPSMDGAAFLPLDPNSKATRERHFMPRELETPLVQDKRFRRNNKRFSPFAWINQRTANIQLNDERMVQEPPQFYLGNQPVDRSNSVTHSPRLKSKKTEKKKKKNQLSMSQEIACAQPRKKALKRAILDRDASVSVRMKPKKGNAETSVLPFTKKARKVLQSLPVDPAKLRSSLDAAPSDTHSENTTELKNKKKLPKEKKKKKKQTKKTIDKTEKRKHTKASSNSPRAGSNTRHDWQTFIRDSIHIDKWDNDGNANDTHFVPHQKQNDTKALARAPATKATTTTKMEKKMKKKRKNKLPKLNVGESVNSTALTKKSTCSQ